jgi:hypothetical protein
MDLPFLQRYLWLQDPARICRPFLPSRIVIDLFCRIRFGNSGLSDSGRNEPTIDFLQVIRKRQRDCRGTMQPTSNESLSAHLYIRSCDVVAKVCIEAIFGSTKVVRVEPSSLPGQRDWRRSNEFVRLIVLYKGSDQPGQIAEVLLVPERTSSPLMILLQRGKISKGKFFNGLFSNLFIWSRSGWVQMAIR